MVKLGKQRIDQTNLIKITSVNYSNNNGIRHSKMPRDKLLRPGENREIRVRASVVLKVNLSICHFLTAATKFSCCSCDKKMLFCSLSLLSAKVLETRSISFSRLRRTFNLHLLRKGRRFLSWSWVAFWKVSLYAMAIKSSATTSLPDMPSLGSYIFRWNTWRDAKRHAPSAITTRRYLEGR